MPHDSIGNWVDKAKSSEAGAETGAGGTVIRRETMSKGNMIMDIAEKIRPFLLKFFEGVRDDQGMLMQPAHIRGIALNMAQGLLRRHENNSKNDNK